MVSWIRRGKIGVDFRWACTARMVPPTRVGGENPVAYGSGRASVQWILPRKGIILK
ncbi:hypothetical protein F2Q69_00062330 [Brassica cretica]|uniref:Uncharacterized protein n=1 Tax=Brassica cretica TaxID=69181 RepID=A0A8S9RDB2_BRACR|nr:hypothetical protein F2Q69_00062330 [Brassica cretica]